MDTVEQKTITRAAAKRAPSPSPAPAAKKTVAKKTKKAAGKKKAGSPRPAKKAGSPKPAKKAGSPKPAKKAAKKAGSPKPAKKAAKKAGSPKTGAVAKRSAIARAAEKEHKIVIVAADGTLKRVGRSGAESALTAVKASGVSAAAVRSASKDMGMVLRKPKDKSRKLSAYHQHMRKYLKEHRAQAKRAGKCMSVLLKEAVAAWTRTHGRKSKKTVGKTGAKKDKKANSKSGSPRN